MTAEEKAAINKAGYELALNLGPRVREALRPLNSLMAEQLNSSNLLGVEFILECVSGAMTEAIVIAKQVQEQKGAGPTDTVQ